MRNHIQLSDKVSSLSTTMETLHQNVRGYRASDVVKVLRNRSHGGESGSEKVGIIFEGGALRGVLSCGYGMGLRKHILVSAFDLILGSSSGALNAVFFATERLPNALSIYVENATDKRCTNPLRFPNVLDVDWLVDNWLFGPKTFDYELLRQLPMDVILVLTNLMDGNPRYFSARIAEYEKLRQAMKATSYAPLLTNQIQIIDGVPYGDGAVSDPIPYDYAVSTGCTHMVCILTRPFNYRKKFTWRGRLFERLRLMHHTRDFIETYAHREIVYNKLLDRLYVTGESCVPTLVLSPEPNDLMPSNIETRPDVISACGLTALQKADSAISFLLK